MNQNQLREYLLQQDLAHDKQMDKIIKDAQPKKINDNFKLKLMKAPIITRDLIGPEYMAERQLLDLSLDLQMQNTIKQAMYALDGKTPEPMKGSVTEEMIADYKKEVMKPVQIGNKLHLYRPVEIPPLVKPAPKPYDHGGLKITEAQLEKEKREILIAIHGYTQEIDQLQEQKKLLEEKFALSSTPTTFDEAARRAILTGPKVYNRDLEAIIVNMGLALPKPKNKANLVDIIIENEKIAGGIDSTVIQQDIQKIDKTIQFYVDEIKSNQADFHQLQTDYDQQADVDEENRLKLIEFDNKKRQVAQEVLSDFNRLNQGKKEVARESNETDDEFLTRLQQMGNIFIDPNDMQKQIETEISNKAKKNILELISDYGKAELECLVLMKDFK